jgi:hypothetical protein
MLFAYPLFLWALGFLLIPIIIHLFQLRRYKKVIFSDIRFLKQITEQNQKQKNIKEWIILAARCLALASLVLAFAKPFIPFQQKTINNASKVISVFVDNSYSMSQLGKEGQLLEIAKNKAKEIVSFYSDKDYFQLLTNDFEGKHQQLLNKNDFLSYLNDVKLSNNTQGFSKIIARQKQAIENEGIENKICYLLTDLQQTQFADINQMDTGLQVNIVPIIPNLNNNISIDSAWIEQPLILPNIPTFLNVKVSNYGNTDLNDVPLVFKIDGLQKGIANITCKANSSVQVQLQFTLNDEKYHQAELSILDNPIVYDDKLYLVLKAYGNQQVIAINANKNIQQIFEIDENFKLLSFGLNSIDFSSFKQAACIILNEIPDFSSGLQIEIQKYLDNGGVVLIIPSANSLAIDKTNLFLQTIQAPSLTMVNNQKLQVVKLNLFDDVFKNVFTKIPEQANWPIINQLYQIKLNSGIKGSKIAVLNNDMPFIFKSKYGNGAVYLLSTPLNTDWSNFSEHALFVPFMLRLPLVNKKNEPLYYHIDKKNLNYPLENNKSKVVYLKNANNEMAFDVNNSFNKSAINITKMNNAGIYQILEQNKTTEIGKIAFNLNRLESNLKPLTIDTLNHANFDIIQTKELLKHQKDINLSYNGTQLWRWFLLAAIAFVLLEVLLLKLKF